MLRIMCKFNHQLRTLWKNRTTRYANWIHNYTLVRMIVMMAGKIMMIFGSRTFDSQWWKLPAKMPLSKSITPWHQSEQIHNTWNCKFNLKPERFTTWLANKSDWIVVSFRFRISPFLELKSLYLPFCPHGDSHFQLSFRVYLPPPPSQGSSP